MKSLLLATGEENSLFPLTAHAPSPMLPIANRPVMVYAVELLIRYGFKEIYINLQNSGEQIEQYLGSGQRWNVQLQYLLQRKAWGTAGALKRAEASLTETFLVLPADTMLDLNIQEALEFHKAHGGLATVIASNSRAVQAPPPHAVETNEQGQIIGLNPYEMGEWAAWNTGAYIFEPEVLDFIPAETVCDCHAELIPALLAAGAGAYAYRMGGFWNPLRSFQDYQNAQVAFLKSLLQDGNAETPSTIRFPYIEGRQIQKGVWLGHNAHVHPRAHLIPPVYIGPESRIGPDVELGPNAVLGSNVVVDAGATVEQSTVLRDTYVGKLVNVADKIANKSHLIDVASGEHVQLTDRFLLAEVNPAIANSIVHSVLERAAALFFLLLSLPALLFLYVLVWATSGKPVLTRVQRVGRKPTWGAAYRNPVPDTVSLVRFRTRLPGGAHTTVGRWLEGWELHRLPELWNVLRGDIGLVGVMPLPPEKATLVQDEWHHKRYGCQAGFTGLWYVQAHVDSDFDELCIVDAYHAVTRTWQSDCTYLLRTPLAWVRRARIRSGGPAAAQSTARSSAQMDMYKEHYGLLQERRADLLDAGINE